MKTRLIICLSVFTLHICLAQSKTGTPHYKLRTYLGKWGQSSAVDRSFQKTKRCSFLKSMAWKTSDTGRPSATKRTSWCTRSPAPMPKQENNRGRPLAKTPRGKKLKPLHRPTERWQVKLNPPSSPKATTAGLTLATNQAHVSAVHLHHQPLQVVGLLNARSRTHTLALLTKHGMSNQLVKITTSLTFSVTPHRRSRKNHLQILWPTPLV